ncbi:MAG TPA: hypothetical protein DCO83_12695, partial [Mucilaginibacter sp.]|nr:hypothetical protein [Mucilaginibacter sp.]
YKNDRNKFFESFGVDQLVNNIKNVAVTMQEVDPEFNLQKQIKIWPVIIFNGKALQSPLMAEIFNKRFQELLGGYKKKRIYIFPLTLVHIGDLEQIQCALIKNPNRIWDLLTYNFRANFLPPFFNTLNRNNIRHEYTPVRKRVVHIFNKFEVNKL